VLGTTAVSELGRGVELLAADAVQALVVLAVKIVFTGAPEAFHAGAVPRVTAGADHVVWGQREWLR
jgi:hypothetical protein